MSDSLSRLAKIPASLESVPFSSPAKYSPPAPASAKVSSSKAKTVHLAKVSIENFFLRHKSVYFLTFSEPGRHDGEAYWTKDEAEAHFKPFRDYCARRSLELLVFWERQKRGAWHPHCLVNGRLDVNLVRPFMVSRGWGQQMRFEWVTRTTTQTFNDSTGQVQSVTSAPKAKWLASYLTKYLTKSMRSTEGATHSKCFGGSSAAKAGGTSFRWAPWVKPGAMLYAAGLSVFLQLNGGESLTRSQLFRHTSLIIRLGVEDTGWADIDPWWEFNFPSPPPSAHARSLA